MSCSWECICDALDRIESEQGDAYEIMVLLASFVTLEILGANITSNVATAMNLMLMVVRERLEGELTFGADGRLFVEDLLATRGRHCGGGRDGRKYKSLKG
jgi:hypothetical protein